MSKGYNQQGTTLDNRLINLFTYFLPENLTAQDLVMPHNIISFTGRGANTLCPRLTTKQFNPILYCFRRLGLFYVFQSFIKQNIPRGSIWFANHLGQNKMQSVFCLNAYTINIRQQKNGKICLLSKPRIFKKNKE